LLNALTLLHDAITSSRLEMPLCQLWYTTEREEPKAMSGVSYAQDSHGSFAHNVTREILRRLFGNVTQGVYLRIASGCLTQSPAMEWLCDAGWRLPRPSDEAAKRDLHLLLVESGDRDPSVWIRTIEIMTAHRPWVVMVDANGSNPPVSGHRLATTGYAFTWFDGTYRYYPAPDRAVRLKPAFTEPLPLEELTPPYIFSDARIAMTLRCRDCDVVPKVADAGQVIDEPGAGSVQVMHNGIRVVADGYGGPWTTRLIHLCRGHHEPQEERVFHEVVSRLPENASMIEIGGYWAYYSLWFLRGGDRRRSIVVEPDPSHLDIGRRNAALNGLSPEFLAGYVGGNAGPPQPFSTESSGVVDLPCFSVPQLLAERGIDQLDLLHCDAQGAEFTVLESCRELFQSGAICWIFISTHACQITGDPLTHQRCLALVRGLGGKVVAEHDVHESFSGDGLIVAWFGSGDPALPLPNISRNRYSESMFRNPLYEIAAASDQAARAQAKVVATEALQAASDAARIAAESAQAAAEIRTADAVAARIAAESAQAAAEIRVADAVAARIAAESAQAAAEIRAADAAAARLAAESAQAAAEIRAADAVAARIAMDLDRAASDLRTTMARAAHDATLREVTALRGSTSWRVTAPLRFLSGLLRRAWR
jgi:FkbM family methyltransferase